jgi:Methyltransferase domain
LKRILKSTAEALLPRELLERLRLERHRRRFGPKRVNFGDLRKTTPVARQYGYPRGEPVDRYFIEKFLAKHSDAIRGRVLEIADREYTLRFGGDRVTQSDVLHVVEGNPHATIVGNLEDSESVPAAAFDCIILTQTLQFTYRFHDALQTTFRALKPSGTLLATFPIISQISLCDADQGWPDYWRFTSQAARRMLADIFGRENVQVESFGNVLTAISFLLGISTQELTPSELDEIDPEFEMLAVARAQKPAV